MKSPVEELELTGVPTESVYKFGTIRFEFIGFEARVLVLDLRDQQYAIVRNDLERYEHHPESALIIFDGTTSKLIAIYGSHEIWERGGMLNDGDRIKRLPDKPYLHVVRVDPRDRSILVQGSHLHTFSENKGFGYDAGELLPFFDRAPGIVRIRKDLRNRLIIRHIFGEDIAPEKS